MTEENHNPNGGNNSAPADVLKGCGKEVFDGTKCGRDYLCSECAKELKK